MSIKKLEEGTKILIDEAGAQVSFGNGIDSFRHSRTIVFVALFAEKATHDDLNPTLRKFIIIGNLDYLQTEVYATTSISGAPKE